MKAKLENERIFYPISAGPNGATTMTITIELAAEKKLEHQEKPPV